jgi:predicted phosphodiesterase
MRIAVVADIHGNVRALRAVMEDLKQVAPDSVVNLGDCASGPLEAAETIDVLMSLAWTTVRGNHDRQVLDRPVEKMGKSDAAAFAELKNHHHAWLSTLEETAIIEDIFLCHGTPGSDTTYLLETVQPDGNVRLATQAEVASASAASMRPIVLCGHTHVPRIVSSPTAERSSIPAASACRLTATSSHTITRPSRAPHARYAVLERAKAADPWQVLFRVVAYDWNGAAERAAAKGREDWARWLRTGYAN